MAKQWQMRRGTTSQNDNFTGVVGELTIDTTTNEIRIHDGSTEGGHIVGETSKQVLNQNTLSTTEKVKTWMGSEAEYVSQDIENEHPDYVCYITDDEPADSQEYNLITYPMRNVGDVFFTSRLDTELNGAVECDGSTYLLSNYQGVDSIYNLFTLGKLEYISMSDYADDIINKGWCDKFGWDGEGNNTFKVPTLTAKVIQENNIPVVGNGKTLGLQNSDGTVRGLAKVTAPDALYPTTYGDGEIGSSVSANSPSGLNNKLYGVTTDPEKSGLVTDSSTVSADLRVMVQLAEACLDDTIEKNSYDLFDVKWTDHTISNIAWARADTFDWKDGRIYTTAYNHLKNEIIDKLSEPYYGWYLSDSSTNVWTKSENPIVGDYVYGGDNIEVIGTVSSVDSTNIVCDGETYRRDEDADMTYSSAQKTETISDITITYYLVEDGHKIVLPDQEFNVSSIYAATGIAWYYIVDIENERFKLPRTKFAFTSIRDTVGNYVAPGLPNIKARIGQRMSGYSNNFDGAAYQEQNFVIGFATAAVNVPQARFDASRYNSIYSDNVSTVQVPATQMYLYFYLGEFTTTSLKNAATLNIETLNKKVEKGHEVVEFQVPTAENDYTWVRKYADGWVEMGGKKTNVDGLVTVNLPVEMANSNYFVSKNVTSGTGDTTSTVVEWVSDLVGIEQRTTTSFKTNTWSRYSITEFYWEVKGMAA